MARVLGINAVFHDPAAALVVDGEIVAAAEEERFSRRKHGKAPVAFSTWELPEQAIAFCLREAGISARDLDAVAYSYDPALARCSRAPTSPPTEWEGLRTLYAQRAPRFLSTALGGWEGDFRFVAHHVAHACSATFASGWDPCSVLVLDGRGEVDVAPRRPFGRGCAGGARAQELPHSLGLLYEELTAHLGFRRSSDEYKVMAMASYGEPAFLEDLRGLVYADGVGGFRVEPFSLARLRPAAAAGRGVQRRARRAGVLGAAAAGGGAAGAGALAAPAHRRPGPRAGGRRGA